MNKTRAEEIRNFANEVSANIRRYLPKAYQDHQILIVENQKNNGVRKIGITCKKPEEHVAQVVYMEGYYDDLQKGTDIHDILNQIAEVIQTDVPFQNAIHKQVVPALSDYESIKNHLVVHLINEKANRELLKGLPHQRVEDLAVICVAEYYYPEFEIMASTNVTHELINQWGISESKVFDTALENTTQKYPPRLAGIDAFMWEVLGFDQSENYLLTGNVNLDKSNIMYFLTNTSRENGASAVLYPGLMDKVFQLFPNGFFIVPSSVHELLIVPNDGMISPKFLGEMVREVNKTLHKQEEYLSDRVYRYDQERQQIRQIPESMLLKRGMER